MKNLRYNPATLTSFIMLIGEYKNTVGAKYRVAIPKKLRLDLVGDLYLTRGPEKSLILLDSNRFSTLKDVATEYDYFANKRRDYLRYYLGGSVQIDPDNQGRFVLPESLRTFAEIDTEVVFIGAYDWIELWSSNAWTRKLENLTDKYGE